MKPTFPWLALMAVAATVILHPLRGGEKPEEPRPPATEAAKPEASRVAHDAKGQVTVTLDAETRERIGLQVAPLAATNLPPEVRGYGRVLDPTPLVQLVAELAPAEVSARNSAREFERLQTLRAQDNVSERALQSAEVQAVRDRLAAEALRIRLRLGWGAALAEYEQLPALVRALAAQESAVVRVDLPAGESLPGPPTGARLQPLAPGPSPAGIQFLGPATSTDPQFQGRGFFVLVCTNPPPPGTALGAAVRIDGPTQAGVLLPATAVVRDAGQSWVYVRTAEGRFTRRPVTLDRPLADGYFVREGHPAGEAVVTVGAQLLLSEERKGEGGEE